MNDLIEVPTRHPGEKPRGYSTWQPSSLQFTVRGLALLPEDPANHTEKVLKRKEQVLPVPGRERRRCQKKRLSPDQTENQRIRLSQGVLMEAIARNSWYREVKKEVKKNGKK